LDRTLELCKQISQRKKKDFHMVTVPEEKDRELFALICMYCSALIPEFHGSDVTQIVPDKMKKRNTLTGHSFQLIYFLHFAWSVWLLRQNYGLLINSAIARNPAASFCHGLTHRCGVKNTRHNNSGIFWHDCDDVLLIFCSTQNANFLF
jgi:hypothetical protein